MMKKKIPKILLDDELFPNVYWQVVTCLNKWNGHWPYSWTLHASLTVLSHYLCVTVLIVALAVRLVLELGVNQNIVLENIIAIFFFVVGLAKTTVTIIFRKERRMFYESVSKDLMAITDKEELAVIEKFAKSTTRFMLVYAVFGSMCVILYQGILYGKITVLYLQNGSYPVKELPLYVEYGIDHEKYYYLCVFHVLLTTTHSYMCIESFDFGYLMSTQHICALFKIVTLRLKMVSKMVNKAETGEISFEDADAFVYNYVISNVVNIHWDILRKVKIVEDTYNINWLFIILINTAGFSIASVVVASKLNDALEFIRYIVILIALFMHFHLIFFSGQEIIDHSTSVSNACYDCLWYKLSKKNRALINIIMIRSCKKCLLTGGSMVHLSLETFGKLLKAGLSFFTVFAVK